MPENNQTNLNQGSHSEDLPKQGNSANKGRKKNFRKRRGNSSTYRPTGIPGSKHNDVSWYLANPELAKAVGSFSMNDPLGTVYHDDTRVMVTTGTQKLYIGNAEDYKKAVPGIAAVHFVPTLPKGKKVGEKFINQLAMKLYVFVRHQNSGHANYEFADLFQALYSILSVNGIYGTLTRLYGTMLQYSVMNKYKAETLVKAQGFDYASFATHIPDLYSLIERLRSAFDTFPIPKKLPVADRQLWMTANVFKDTEDEKSPLWLFVQDYYYPVPNIDGEQILSQTPWNGSMGSADDGTADFEDVENFVDDIISSFSEHEDYGIIFGDILKAYGRENCAVLAKIPEDYTVSEVLDPNANLQLKNASVLDYNPTNGLAKLYQDSDTHRLKFEFRVQWSDGPSVNSMVVPGDHTMLAFPKKDITPGDMLVATRLCSRWTTSIPTGRTYADLAECGTEMLTMINIFNFYSAQNTDGLEVDIQQYQGASLIAISSTNFVATLNGLVNYTKFISAYYQFSNLPRVYLTGFAVSDQGNLAVPTSLHGMFDMACFVEIDASNLDSLNYTAAMSEFGYTDAAQVG